MRSKMNPIKFTQLVISFIVILFANLACRILLPQPVIKLSTPTPTLPAQEQSLLRYFSWSSAPTPLPEVSFPPAINNTAILNAAEEKYQQGRKAYEEQNWKEALDAFSQALELNPRHALSYYYRGQAYLRLRGNQTDLFVNLKYNDLAIMDFTRSITAGNETWEPYYARGSCYYHRAQVEPLREYRKLWRQLALEDVNHALDLDREQGKARSLRVSIYLDMGECDKAFDDLQTPFWQNTASSEEVIYWIKMYRCQGNFDEALRLVNENILRDENPNLYWERGLIYAAQGDYKKGSIDLDTAARLWPNNLAPGTIWYNRAGIEYHLGRYDLAKDYIQQGQQKTWINWGTPYYYLGKIFSHEGNIQQAIEALLWAEQTLDEGKFLDATRNELIQLGVISAKNPAGTSLPFPTPVQSPSPEIPAIPTEITGEIAQVHDVFVLLEMNETFLNKLAGKIQAGELSSLENENAKQLFQNFLSEADGVISMVYVPEILESKWEKAMTIHEKTKKIFQQWIDQKIKPPQMLAETQLLSDELDTILLETEQIMTDDYGFKIDELAKQRQEILANVDRIFGPSSTPTP